ncbi:hypothetical protein [Streptomyces mirabilis]|uniref:hypothetical protein n=1 Tax=Streptomyces mirabilis TaxID=68239 RepID=UPI0033AD1E71
MGEKQTFLIIRESLYGSTRFEQFHAVLQCPHKGAVRAAAVVSRVRGIVGPALDSGLTQDRMVQTILQCLHTREGEDFLTT